MNEIEALEAKIESLSMSVLFDDPARLVAQLRLMNYLSYITAPLGTFERGFVDEPVTEALAPDRQSQGTARD